jgi:caa(3)-type oxidase subunit IV
MSAAEKPPVGYVTIWVWLMMLIALGVALISIPLSKPLAVALIFTVATVKAGLVIRHYMHVRNQPWMIYAMIGVPLVLVIVMIIALLPDIAFRP